MSVQKILTQIPGNYAHKEPTTL